MSQDYGTGVTRVMDPEDIAYLVTVFQRNKPPTDAEVNFIGQINTEERAKILRSMMPSGWVASPTMPHLDFYSFIAFSNFFYMGRQLEIETTDETEETPDIRNIAYAAVNGWVIPVTGTQVNNLTTLNDDDYRNKIILDFAPTSGYQTNFVFLEVWQALIAPTPSTANKPTGDTIYKWGNVEFGGTNPTEDLIPPDIGAETTKRIQLQYRIRMVSSIDLVNYPTGFGDEDAVYARANLTEAEAAALASTIDTSFHVVTGDEGLWRAGDGDPENGLGTVDGYTYAIPICAVARRNRGGWSISTINGGVSRRTPPTGYVEGDPDTGCPMTPAQIAAAPDSDRPDGLYADLIVVDDIIDMRHHVSPVEHDYESMLEEALNTLLNGTYRVSPKMSTVGGTQYGKKILYTDEITAGADNPSTITIGEPDGVRRLFSDVPAHQGRNFFEIGPASKDPGSPSYGTNPDRWMPKDIIKVDHPESLHAADWPSTMLTEAFQITYRGGTTPIVADFVDSATANTLVRAGAFAEWSSDSDQFQGYALQITAGTGSGRTYTINTIDSDDQITIFGSFSLIPDATSAFAIIPLVIVASATSDTTAMTITIDSINGDEDFASTEIQDADLRDDMWIDYTMHYPAGQGLSLRPDSVLRVNYTNPASTVLRAPTTDVNVNLLVPRYINHSRDFVNQALPDGTYFGTEPVEASCYRDEGSKTVVVQPWQLVTAGIQPRKHAAFTPTHNYYGLFSTEFALEIPRPYLPKLDASAIPIIETAYGSFYTGFHVWCFNETDAGAEVVINLMGRSTFDQDDFVGTTVFARQDDIAYEVLDAGAPDRIGCRINPDMSGIELPTYMGLARIIGIFERSDFDINGIGGTNLLKFDTIGTDVASDVWVGRTTGHTDVTFTILPGAIDGYADTTEYVIVANSFGFREGFIHENALVTAHEQVTSVNETVTLQAVVTQALPSSAVVQITYDRTPYQGSIYNRMEPFADTTPEPFNNRGLVSPTDLTDLDVPLDSDPEQGTIFHYEVLAAKEFTTTLGTARFSGMGTARFYDIAGASFGYPDGAPRFELLPLSDVHVDRAGFITRLPLGARYRDADFVGEDIVTGVDRGPYVNYSGEVNPTTQIYSESTLAEALGAGQVVTLTQGNISPADTTQYRVTRGGSGYLQTEGGPLLGGSKNLQMGFKTLHCVAALIKNHDENGPLNFDLPWNPITNPNVLKGRGGEIQLVIMTGVDTPIYETQAIYENQTINTATSAGGVGEGYVAVDRYRVAGKPLEHQPHLITYEEQAPVAGTYEDRVATPSISSIFPPIAAPDMAVVVRGTGLSVVRSATTGDGAEIYLRPQEDVTDENYFDLTPWVTDSRDDLIIFRTPNVRVLDEGGYDLIVRSGDGQVAT